MFGVVDEGGLVCTRVFLFVSGRRFLVLVGLEVSLAVKLLMVHPCLDYVIFDISLLSGI